MGREAIGQRSETVRRANLSAIARELHLRGPVSRSGLVDRTGLTRSAIRGLIGEFVDAGLAIEERSLPVGTPGRPSPVLRPNTGAAVALALEISVDSLAAALVGFGGRVIELKRVDRAREHISADEIVADLVSIGRPMLNRASAASALLGIGVAVVGVVRRSDGMVMMAPNLGWRDAPLGERLARAMELAGPVSVANEADLGALAEHRRGAAVGVDDVIYLSGEVGVGAGIIAGGLPLSGAAGYGGEAGHMPVVPGGVPCRCGSVGCWETVIGERALLERVGRDPDGGRQAIDQVLQQAVAGSQATIAELREVGRWLGVGLAGLVNVLNPRLVVLGGLFHRAFPFIAAAVEAELDRLALPASRALVRVVPAMLAENAPLVGAAETAFEGFLTDPAAWLRQPAPPVTARTA